MHKTKRIRSYLDAIGATDVRITNQALVEEISDANVLITTGSSIAFDSIRLQRPVIIVSRNNGLSQNPFNLIGEHRAWVFCYTQNEVLNAINSYRADIKDNNLLIKELSWKIIEGYHSTMSSSKVREILHYN